jgi:hypothetical protein
MIIWFILLVCVIVVVAANALVAQSRKLKKYKSFWLQFLQQQPVVVEILISLILVIKILHEKFFKIITIIAFYSFLGRALILK